MKGVNKVILVGTVGKDPEVKYLPSGSAVANITVATSDQWKDKQSGESQERTEWHRVVLFNRLGEIAGEYLRKGSKVYIEGRLQTREWEKDGVKRYTTEIVASEMQMLGGRGTDSASGSNNAPGFKDEGAPSEKPAPKPTSGGNFDDFDDDIPF